MAPPVQAFVFPVCRFEEEGGQALIRRFHGTAFLANGKGLFITARHVMRNAEADVKEQNGFLGVNVKGGVDLRENRAARPLSWTPAPGAHDIAVGILHAVGDAWTPVRFVDGNVDVLQDVFTFGYPDTAHVTAQNQMWFGLRSLRGYIQRVMGDEAIPTEGPPLRYETSFLIGPGLSGAPLLVPHALVDTSYGLLGVCVGSVRSQIIDDEVVETLEDGKVYRETILRIEHHGIAHALSPLYEWRPDCLEGATLGSALPR